MKEICIVVLSGLPGSGKTYVSHQLSVHTGTMYKEDRTLKFISVEYDKLMPFDVEKALIEVSEKNEQQWKEYRAEIVNCVDWFVQSLVTDTLQHELDLKHSAVPSSVRPSLWETFVALVPQSMSSLQMGTHSCRLCIVVDDNMYYRSMRYTYYQLARKYTISYCHLHVKSDIQTAITRNSCRDVRVNDDVIVTMATKMEEPDAKAYSWEKYSLVVESNNLQLENIFHLINDSFSEPVQAVEEEDVEMKNQSRLVCSESFIHQSDQILRRLVSEEMQQVKERHLSRTEMRDFAKTLQTRRKELLTSLKAGSLHVPVSLVTMATDVSKSPESELFMFLKTQFLIGLENT